MKRPTLLTPLFLHLLLLSVPSASAVCNDQTARPIDGEVLLLLSVDAAFINEVGLLIAGAAVKRRNAVPVQIRDVFSCSADEECLSLDRDPFCFNQKTGFFHAPDGTTGNARTGAYTLADGEVGNMYNGPHPLPSSTGNVGTQQTAATTATAEATGFTSKAGAQTATTGNGVGRVTPTATPMTGQGGTSGAIATPATVTATQPAAMSQKNGASGLKACWVTVVGALGVLRVLLAVV